MKKELKIISATILILSICVAVFSSCNIKTEDDDSLNETSVRSTDYTYKNETITMHQQTEYVYDVPPVPTDPVREEPEENNQTETTAKIKETLKAVEGGKVDEILNGLSLVTKTTPVIKGNTATIMILGTPDASYSIEIDDKNVLTENLKNRNADSAGFASWTFMINSNCESGEKKIIIRELNSDKYIQTSIIVQ